MDMRKILLILLLLVSLKSFSQKRYNENDRKNTGVTLIVGGVAFTTAALLENGYSYGTYVKNPTPGNPMNQTYVTPNFWEQSPRQIMFVVGVSLTITGLFTLRK
jgi:hypothetical protein